jgi:tRNA-specific 2-thiouridylase
VLRIEAQANRLVVGRREELATSQVTLTDVSFIDPGTVEPVACQVRLRYHSRPVPAVFEHGVLSLGEPFYGAAPGQAAVMYDGSHVLGGGTIAA